MATPDPEGIPVSTRAEAPGCYTPVGARSDIEEFLEASVSAVGWVGGTLSEMVMGSSQEGLRIQDTTKLKQGTFKT